MHCHPFFYDWHKHHKALDALPPRRKTSDPNFRATKMGRVKDSIGRRSNSPFVFDVVTEAKKVLRIVQSVPMEHRTLCNDEDLKAMPFADNDIGFFICLVPGQIHGEPSNFTYVAEASLQREANHFMARHRVQQLTEGVLLVSSGCSWDIARRKLSEALCLGYGVIAFSTIGRLQVLAENPSNRV